MTRKTDPLLQPLTIKGLTLKNRVLSTSHACGLEEGGMPAERYQRYHEEKAKGGIALSMFGGSSNVAPDSPSVFQQLYVGDDRIIAHFRAFADRMHAHGAALMCQITHLGRRGEPFAGNWLPTIGPSAIREPLHRSTPKEMDEDDIARVIRAYGQAARRCKEGGLDGVETLAAGHLIGQFLSPAMNQRTDRFGGSFENRLRFPLMVHQEIRRQVGPDFIVGMRLPVEEGGEGWMSLDDCIKAAQVLEAEGGLDFFNAIYGRSDTERGQARDSMPGMDSPIAPWVVPVGAFKREVGLPVFHAARVSDVASARHAIREGLLDMVGMTRAHIADPHLVQKLTEGREEQIRPCVGATHCMSGYRPACLHNAATGREATLPHHATMGTESRKVVIVGGGPAGLEAARISAERGHKVVLFEAASALGGQVRLGTQGSWRRDLIGLVDWREAEIQRLGVTVRLNSWAEAEDIDHYDAAIATLAIISVCAVLSVAFGVPIGIAMSKSDRLQQGVLPVLDMLQTLPAFVYLIPLIFLFSVTEPKLYGMAIILYAIVPVIRLTDLGIRMVDRDVIEAADAFGMTWRQRLFEVEIPLAMPNIMAGVNQTIMMALSMVVIASLVSAPGLGLLVLRGINTLELGTGLVAGMAIVLLAIVLDRVSKSAVRRASWKTQ